MKHSTVRLSDLIDFIKSKMECSPSIMGSSQDFGIYPENIFISEVIKLDTNNVDPFALFWINQKNLHKLDKLTTGIVLCPMTSIRHSNFTGVLIRCDNPRRAFSLVLNAFFKADDTPFPPRLNAYPFKSSVPIGTNVGHGTIIEENVSIGNNVNIGYNNVILKGTVIKDNVKIGSNNTIGGVGFGYEKNEDGQWEVIPHIGNVVIEEGVEIGNNNCIDRAVLGSTLLKKNCKIDNLIHIAHGAIIGENSLIIANSMIAGSAVIGNNTWIAPSTSVINGGKVGSNSMTGMGAVVVKEVGDNELAVGIPAKKIKDI